MTLDISRCQEHYDRVVAFAKAIGLYEPIVPEPSPDGARYWEEQSGECRFVRVLRAENDAVELLKLPCQEFSGSAQPDVKVLMSVAKLRAEWLPRNWQRESNSMRFLKHCLDWLDGYAEGDGVERIRGRTRCTLYYDSAPGSFGFTIAKRNAGGEYERWMNGGLLYHGPTTGWGEGADRPVFAVTMEQVHGWQIHT
jgi:hypothetical protein